MCYIIAVLYILSERFKELDFKNIILTTSVASTEEEFF